MQKLFEFSFICINHPLLQWIIDAPGITDSAPNGVI